MNTLKNKNFKRFLVLRVTPCAYDAKIEIWASYNSISGARAAARRYNTSALNQNNVQYNFLSIIDNNQYDNLIPFITRKAEYTAHGTYYTLSLTHLRFFYSKRFYGISGMTNKALTIETLAESDGIKHAYTLDISMTLTQAVAVLKAHYKKGFTDNKRIIE